LKGARIRRLCAALALVLTLALALGAPAQQYPAKPIRVVVAGSGAGEAAPRAFAQEMSAGLGQPIVIDPQSAAGGALAAQIVARATPDGYTLLYSSPNVLVFRLFLVKDVGYDPVKDFTPIARAVETALCIAASVAAPFATLRELIDYARAHPGEVSYSTTGVGTGHHLNAEQLKSMTGIELVHVPYKTGAQQAQDLVAGRVPVGGSPLSNVVPMVRAGKLRVLAIVGQNRSPLVPDVPTVREVVPGFESIEGWSAYFGPAGMPRAIVARLHGEIANAAAKPAVRAQLEQLGYAVGAGTPEELDALVRRDLGIAARLAAKAGVRPE
jgi:tripartite-type tricarboxylate transporter receptor subunit TctC